VAQALLRHDWVYRWETVLRTAGLKPLAALTERKSCLEKVAASVVADSTDQFPPIIQRSARVVI
jgi:hypothetical protein